MRIILVGNLNTVMNCFNTARVISASLYVGLTVKEKTWIKIVYPMAFKVNPSTLDSQSKYAQS